MKLSKITLIRDDDQRIFIPNSAAYHLKQNLISERLIQEGFHEFDLDGSYDRVVRQTIDFGRIIGNTSCIETDPITPDTVTLFARRGTRIYPSRVSLETNWPPSTKLTMIVQRMGENAFNLLSAYVGDAAPPEPFSFKVIRQQGTTVEACLTFWCRHAMIYDKFECIDVPFEKTWNEVVAEAREEVRLRDDEKYQERVARRAEGGA